MCVCIDQINGYQQCGQKGQQVIRQKLEISQEGELLLPSSAKPSKASASTLAELSLIIDSSHPPGKVPKLEI